MRPHLFSHLLVVIIFIEAHLFVSGCLGDSSVQFCSNILWTVFSSVPIGLEVLSLSFIFPFSFHFSVLTDCFSDHGSPPQSFCYVFCLAVSKSYTHINIVPLYVFFSPSIFTLFCLNHILDGLFSYEHGERKVGISLFLFPL